MDTSDTIDESVELDTASGRLLRPGRRTVGFLTTVAVILAAFCYDLTQVPADEQLLPPWRAEGLPGWDVALIEWLFLLSLAVIVWYLLYPLASNPALTRQYWQRLRGNRRAVVSLGIVVVFYVVGIAGPFALDILRVLTGITGPVGPRGITPVQPPVGFTVPVSLTSGSCVGKIVDGMCHGTLQHPLGTNKRLHDILVWTVDSTQSAMYVATVAATLAAPVGVGVGTAAAYFGGRVDQLLMRYVDLQLVIPPFFVYLFVQVFLGRSYVLLVALFGLLNWGSLARLVRSEALSKTDLGYMRAAEDAGSGPLRTIRRHLLPNVSNSIVTGVTSMVPTVILVEVSLAFVQLSSPIRRSWGGMISGSSRIGGAGAIVIDGFAFVTWWTEIVPVIVMLSVILAFSVLGDALRDVLDPQSGG